LAHQSIAGSSLIHPINGICDLSLNMLFDLAVF
jgi:hypothetical protein